MEIVYEHTITCHPRRRTRPTPPNIDAILAGLPLSAVEQLVDVLAGKQNSPDATVNVTRCIQALIRWISPHEEIAIYEWAHGVQRDLGAYGAGADAETPYTEVVWDRLINLASTERTAQFVHEIAAGLCRKTEETIQ